MATTKTPAKSDKERLQKIKEGSRKGGEVVKESIEYAREHMPNFGKVETSPTQPGKGH